MCWDVTTTSRSSVDKPNNNNNNNININSNNNIDKYHKAPMTSTASSVGVYPFVDSSHFSALKLEQPTAMLGASVYTPPASAGYNFPGAHPSQAPHLSHYHATRDFFLRRDVSFHDHAAAAMFSGAADPFTGLHDPWQHQMSTGNHMYPGYGMTAAHHPHTAAAAASGAFFRYMRQPGEISENKNCNYALNFKMFFQTNFIN